MRLMPLLLEVWTLGPNITQWKAVEQWFNEGFLTLLIVFHLLINFISCTKIYHNIITLNSAAHGTISSQELHKIWKEIQSDHDWTMIKFIESDNQNSSFTTVEMEQWIKQQLVRLWWSWWHWFLRFEEGCFSYFKNCVPYGWMKCPSWEASWYYGHCC